MHKASGPVGSDPWSFFFGETGMFYLGVDIAKAKLDCLLLDAATQKRKSKTVANSIEGIVALLKSLQTWGIDPLQLSVMMEPTGSYHELAAFALADAGCSVCLVNPAQLRSYAQALGVRGKSDATDAALLARYGAVERPAPWQPPSLSVRTLRALLARRDAVAEDLQRERNRAEKTEVTDAPAAVDQSLRNGIAFLEKQLETLQHAIAQHIDDDPDLKDKRNLLLTIPGVGERVSEHMTALLAGRSFNTAEQVAAYLGLVPIEWQSGSSIRGKPRLSKAGPAHLRKLLYLPAVVATRHNPHIRALYLRLLDKGKPKMAAIGAAMRKLAHLCFGVVHSGKPYDRNYRPKKA
jgi:transposase